MGTLLLMVSYRLHLGSDGTRQRTSGGTWTIDVASYTHRIRRWGWVMVRTWRIMLIGMIKI